MKTNGVRAMLNTLLSPAMVLIFKDYMHCHFKKRNYMILKNKTRVITLFDPVLKNYAFAG